MGRNPGYNPPPGNQPRGKNGNRKSGGCSNNWSTLLLYLLVILALLLSVINFWLGLYRQQQLRNEFRSYKDSDSNDSATTFEFARLRSQYLNEVEDLKNQVEKLARKSARQKEAAQSARAISYDDRSLEVIKSTVNDLTRRVATFNPDVLISMQRNITNVSSDVRKFRGDLEAVNARVDNVLIEAVEAVRTLTTVPEDSKNITDESLNLLRRELLIMKNAIDNEKARYEAVEAEVALITEATRTADRAKDLMLDELRTKEAATEQKLDDALFRIGSLDQRQVTLRNDVERVVNRSINLDQNLLESQRRVLQLNSTTRNLSDLLSNLDQRTDLLVQEMETTIQNRLFEDLQQINQRMEALKYEVTLIKNETLNAFSDLKDLEVKLIPNQELQGEVEKVKQNNRKFIQTLLRVQRLPTKIRGLEQRIQDLEDERSS